MVSRYAHHLLPLPDNNPTASFPNIAPFIGLRSSRRHPGVLYGFRIMHWEIIIHYPSSTNQDFLTRFFKTVFFLWSKIPFFSLHFGSTFLSMPEEKKPKARLGGQYDFVLGVGIPQRFLPTLL
jgi:hypothetical protein